MKRCAKRRCAPGRVGRSGVVAVLLWASAGCTKGGGGAADDGTSVPRFDDGAGGAVTPMDRYRYFRGLSIDLLGRIPTSAEVRSFEAPDFDLETWVDERLQGAPYAERLRRVYMDLLRLEVGRNFSVASEGVRMQRIRILTESGEETFVYYRHGQRRTREETDGDFCLTAADTGLRVLNAFEATSGTRIPVSKAALDAHTTLVTPWWLTKDFRNPNAARVSDDPNAKGELVVGKDLLFDADGTTPVTRVRVCKEEAQTADVGQVVATGRKTRPAGAPPYGRAAHLPLDSNFATKNAGKDISCSTVGLAFQNSARAGAAKA